MIMCMRSNLMISVPVVMFMMGIAVNIIMVMFITWRMRIISLN